MYNRGFPNRRQQNIFVYENSPHWKVKIGDFGFTKRAESKIPRFTSSVGTTPYQAPEIRLSVGPRPSAYTIVVDVWSLGCVTYDLLTLKMLFQELSDLQQYCKTKLLPMDPLRKRNVSFEAIEFLQNVLQPIPSKRWEIDDILSSKWLADYSPKERSDGPWSTSNSQPLPSRSKPPETSLMSVSSANTKIVMTEAPRASEPSSTSRRIATRVSSPPHSERVEPDQSGISGDQWKDLKSALRKSPKDLIFGPVPSTEPSKPHCTAPGHSPRKLIKEFIYVKVKIAERGCCANRAPADSYTIPEIILKPITC